MFMPMAMSRRAKARRAVCGPTWAANVGAIGPAGLVVRTASSPSADEIIATERKLRKAGCPILGRDGGDHGTWFMVHYVEPIDHWRSWGDRDDLE